MKKAKVSPALQAARDKEHARWMKSGRRTIVSQLLSECQKCLWIGPGHYCQRCGEKMSRN